MNRCLIGFLVVSALLVGHPCDVVAQVNPDGVPAQVSSISSSLVSGSLISGFNLLGQVNRGGAYLSWWKLLAIGVPFLLWVGVVDWMNKDALKIGQDTGLRPEVWNPVFVLTMLVGFFCGISIPWFAAGLPIYLVAAFFPPALYFFIRRSRLKSNPAMARKAIAIKKGVEPEDVAEPLPQDEGVAMKFSASGNDDKQKQVNLIQARQTGGFPQLKEMLSISLKSRADVVLLDYTREHVTARMQVDGAWHALPAMDRVTGDAALASIKFIANLNPQERRSKQEGFFGVATAGTKANIDVVSQGVPTGERVQLKYRRKVKHELTLGQLGMWPEMFEPFKKHLDRPGLVIVSAPPGAGLTATWRGMLLDADRITRDCVAVVDQFDTETDVENIGIHRYDSAAGQSPASILKTLLLSQPDSLAVPSVANAKSLDALVAEANNEERTILTRTQAKSAAEALLRMFAASNDKSGFAHAVKAVTCQRLLRRLCDRCKTPVQVAPKLIQQLGGDPQQQQTIFNPFKMPPPEQLIDEKGNPIEIKPCKTCAALGYIGRIAAFEMIEVTDKIRHVLLSNPKVDAIEQAARKAGKATLQRQLYRLVLVGITSLAEVQRVLKT